MMMHRQGLHLKGSFYSCYGAEKKSSFLLGRYGVLLAARDVEDSDRAQTLALLDTVEAEEGHYQLGLTKVLLLG